MDGFGDVGLFWGVLCISIAGFGELAIKLKYYITIKWKNDERYRTKLEMLSYPRIEKNI